MPDKKMADVVPRTWWRSAFIRLCRSCTRFKVPSWRARAALASTPPGRVAACVCVFDQRRIENGGVGKNTQTDQHGDRAFVGGPGFRQHRRAVEQAFLGVNACFAIALDVDVGAGVGVADVARRANGRSQANAYECTRRRRRRCLGRREA